MAGDRKHVTDTMRLRETVAHLSFLFSFSSVELSVVANPHLVAPWQVGLGRPAVSAASPGAVPSDPVVWGHVAAQGAVLTVAQAQAVQGWGVKEAVGLHRQNLQGSFSSL